MHPYANREDPTVLRPDGEYLHIPFRLRPDGQTTSQTTRAPGTHSGDSLLTLLSSLTLARCIVSPLLLPCLVAGSNSEEAVAADRCDTDPLEPSKHHSKKAAVKQPDNMASSTDRSGRPDKSPLRQVADAEDMATGGPAAGP